MKDVITAEDLMEQLITMNEGNSVCQVIIPGKGTFTIVLQEVDDCSTAPVIQSDLYLQQMTKDTEKEASAKSVSEIIRNPFL